MDRRKFLVSAGVAALSAAGCAARADSPASKSRKSVEDAPVILEVAISGTNSKKNNPLVPESAAEQIAEMDACFDAGATIVHSHSNHPDPDPEKAAEFYRETFGPIRKRYPHAILYATANFDPKVNNKTRTVWRPEVQCGHQEILAREGLANMVLFDTGVVPLAGYDDQGVAREDAFFWYGFWPGDTRFILDVCKRYGTGTSISVFEPDWMKNVHAMALLDGIVCSQPARVL